MADITVLKFPPYYNKKDIKNINKVKPDVLIFDDEFSTSVDEFNLPDSIIYIEFGKKFNKSLRYFKFPKYLKGLKFGEDFAQSLDYVVLPEYLEKIEFGNGYKVSLFCVQFPNSLREIVLNNDFYFSLPNFLPNKIEKLMLGKRYDYSLNTFVIPDSLKYLRINGSVNNKVLLDNLPTNLKTLEIINNLDFDMTNLPELIEELIIDIPVSNFYLNNLMGGGMGLLNNIRVEPIKEQTNLPNFIKKIKLSDVSLVKYIKKIPFDCEIVDLKDKPYIFVK
jgi:hypothetical protein